MAITQLNQEINKLRDKAHEYRGEHARKVEAIRADRLTSAEGKRNELSKNYAYYDAEIAKLSEKETALVTAKRAEIERRVFGQFSSDGASIIAYRDAQDRVERLTHNEQSKALSMLRNAELSGDKTLSAALVSKALSYGWNDVLAQYNKNHPSEASDLNDLADIIHFQEDVRMDFQREMDYASLLKPNEIARLSDGQIQRYAEFTPEPYSQFG